MSLEAGTPLTPSAAPENPSSTSSLPPSPSGQDESLDGRSASVDSGMQESDELRRRRRRRRRTVADLPPAQKRFRLVLLGLVVLALIVAANGKEVRPIIGGIVGSIKSVLPIATVKQYLRPELLLLAGALFIMVILLFPDVEEKVLVTLGIQKARRPHRSRSSRRRSRNSGDS